MEKVTCAYCCEDLTREEIKHNEDKGRDEHSNMYCDPCETELEMNTELYEENR